MENTARRRARASRMICTLAVCFGLACGTLSLSAELPNHRTAAEASLLKAEDALFAADVSRDLEVIKRGFADEAIFVHANGMVQTKADYLRAAEAATNPVKSITTENRVVRLFGNVGVTRATKNLVVGNDMHLSGSYLTVYIKRDGRWQMLDSQSAPAPRNPDARPPEGGKPSENK